MFVETVFADSGNSIFGEEMEFEELYLLIISLIVLFSTVATTIFILWGGVLVILSGGNPDKIKPAINTIRYALFGLIVVVVTLFIAPIMGRLLGLSTEVLPTPKVIFNEVSRLAKNIFGESNDESYYIISENGKSYEFENDL